MEEDEEFMSEKKPRASRSKKATAKPTKKAKELEVRY
jgi:hypothetical protein